MSMATHMSKLHGLWSQSLIKWLLEEENPSVRYFTLRDLLGKDEADSDVRMAKSAISASKIVARILTKQTAKGHWEDEHNPYRPKYKSTYWQVMILGQLGMNKVDERVQKACEYVFSLQLDEGGFSSHTPERVLEEYEWMRTRTALKEKLQPDADSWTRTLVREHQYTCLTGNVCAAMLRMGYNGDPRLRKALNWLVSVQNVDGGWLCPYWKAHIKDTHSCFYGAICPFEAFSEVSGAERTTEMKRAIESGAEFLLMHRLFKADHHNFRVINRQWLRFSFPWFYGYDILRGLSVLTKLGYINDSRLTDAVKLLIQKRRPNGTWLLDSSPTGRMQANIEAVGEPSKWITLNALRVLKRLQKTKSEQLKEVLSKA